MHLIMSAWYVNLTPLPLCERKGCQFDAPSPLIADGCKLDAHFSLMLMLMMVMTAMMVMMVMAVMLDMILFAEVAARIPCR